MNFDSYYEKEQAFRWAQYDFLVQYCKETPGRWPVKEEEYQGFYLGVWCEKQKTNYENNVLMPDRIQALMDIHFPFEPKTDHEGSNQYLFWMDKFNLLTEYRKEYP